MVPARIVKTGRLSRSPGGLRPIAVTNSLIPTFQTATASWFETRDVAAPLTMRNREALIPRSALLRASRRM
jgi:hypothetical protein